jgi:hypothetical protein
MEYVWAHCLKHKKAGKNLYRISSEGQEEIIIYYSTHQAIKNTPLVLRVFL